MVHIALEARCHVLSACPFTRLGEYPPDQELPDGKGRSPDEIQIAGGSLVVSPLGEILVDPLPGEGGVLSGSTLIHG
jgi:hypothetical protein